MADWPPSNAPTVGRGKADSESAEGQQFPIRLARWGGVPPNEPRGEGPQTERSLQRRGLHRGGCGHICQKGRLWPRYSDAFPSRGGKKNHSKHKMCCFLKGHSKRLQDNGSPGQSYRKERAVLTLGWQWKEVRVCEHCLLPDDWRNLHACCVVT